ncbi:nucleotidyltransferase family protein [bacterium]|nr:nucleotidyltransferase family protein [bacterium]
MSVAAVILAAGASKRMKEPKALLKFDGEPAVFTLFTTLVRASYEPVVTVTSSSVKEELDRLMFPGAVVINDETEKGALLSFRLGLQTLPDECDSALLCPVDHPLVRRETLQTIKAAASRTHIIVPCYKGQRGHPTLFGHDFWPLLFSLPLEEGARGVLHRKPEAVILLDVDDPGVVQNLNSPSDLTDAGL